ncbi:ABC transporter ATP-binding protein [Bacillus horti]|uniref:ATP-binding cassette subfamily B protein n=1 Tax=Caldalkalibacillus horti TaxID=77523 RepID=A0ABT9VX35_9BACI|nr:ABC transporter ATP-binding protein [Bacillus horti]MDQ0165553.1 ATP-binding cassette subfamily B protein [Bacillus horti]
MSQPYTTERLAKKHIFRRLMRYAWPHKKSLLIAFIILMIATGADIAGPFLLKVFIDNHLTPFIEQGIAWQWTIIGVLFAVYAMSLIVNVGLSYVQAFQFQKIALNIIQQLRIDVFGQVQHLGLTFFDQTPGGSLVSRITNDTEAIKDLYISVLAVFLQNILFLIGIFVAMFFLDVQLALFCLVILPVIFMIMWAYRALSAKVYHISRAKLSQLNAKLSESLQGMNIIQVFSQEKRLHKSFDQINEEHNEARMGTIKLNGLLLRPAVDFVYLITLMIVLWYFGILSLEANSETAFQIGVLYAFVNYLGRFFEPVNTMMQRLAQYQQAMVSAERVFGLLDDDRLAPSKQGKDQPKITDGRIVFDNVTFSYDGKTDVLKNISFTAEPGQTVALVGHTGSGKSSITNLLMHFYSVEQGHITIDGKPLQTYTNEEIRKNVGLVLQDAFLFVGDIKHNIRLHNMEITDEQLEEAARFVQADTFIQKLPQKYNEPVGERGATFSSGQRQLLSFARTMALQPKILVLDEATANVDTETEEAIQLALDKMRKGRTTIAIAHRLSTIQDADLILVLHQGEIVERGTHQELLGQEGLYHKMYLLQQGAHKEVKEVVQQEIH